MLLTADIGGTNCRFSLWQANIKADVVYDEVFTKVKGFVVWCSLHLTPCIAMSMVVEYMRY